MMGDLSPRKSQSPNWSDSGSGTSGDHVNILHEPVPTRPRLPSRKSSGTMIVSRDSAIGPIETTFAPDDVRSMSPRRTSEDIESLGKEAREELQRHAKALQDSLIVLFNRIEAVKEEHDKLDNHNKFLQKIYWRPHDNEQNYRFEQPSEEIDQSIPWDTPGELGWRSVEPEDVANAR